MTLSLVPRPVRRLGGRVRAELVRSQVAAELQRIARSGRVIVAGPWLGEVGFEILYWVPFLRWAQEEFGIDRSRIVVISRGGPESWYADLAARYVDVFDHLSVAAYRTGNERRRHEVGEQKQVRETAFDKEIASMVQRGSDLADAERVHPSLMYRLFQPYWWKHASEGWIARHSRPLLLQRPELPAGLDVQPGAYVAVKLYPNDCLPDDAASRAFAAEAIAAIAARMPVVTLDTGLSLDDHAGENATATRAAGAGEAAPEAKGVHSITSFVTPSTNLAVQTAVLANARAFVGTYGGFSYLPPLHVVPAIGLYSRPFAFDRAHLHVAQRMFMRLGAPRFEVRDIAETPPQALADLVAEIA